MANSTRTYPAGAGTIAAAHPDLESLVPPNAVIEQVAGGFDFTEGPLWMPGGFLIFSDIPRNTIYRWDDAAGVAVYRQPSGYYGHGDTPPPGPQPGSNGLTLDAQRRLVACEHGNRRLTRLEPDGSVTVLADRFEGRRLNSPNDVIAGRDGAVWFTDPPYGLAQREEDPARELPFSALFRLAGGQLTAIWTELRRPNGLALSPDERVLYLVNSDAPRRVCLRFELPPGGPPQPPDVFFDVTGHPDPGNPDGMKVDRQGNVYATGPGGVWIFSPQGAHLGIIRPPELPANCHWGGDDARTLYITARTGLYRIRLNVPGIRPLEQLRPA